MLELVTSEQTEQEFYSLVEQLADPSRYDQLIDLLREDHPAYHQRGASTVVRMRGWILLALARIKLPDAVLPFVLEELDTGIDAYLVAAAALALRSYSTPDPAFVPFVVRAIGNIRYRDQRVSVDTYGGYAVGATGTTAVRELLETLVWLGPQARSVASEVKLLHEGPTALPKKYWSDVQRALDAIQTGVDTRDCCQLPNGIRELFSSVRMMRKGSEPIDSVVFEDQDGETISFREFFRGRSSIVVFFYTRCDNPLKCSLTITKLARIQELLASKGLAEQINTAGITYDPGFDLPARLRNYGEHRALNFGPKHRLLRARDGLDAIRKHFKLGVNFIESLVNRHRIEVYILDAEGRIAASFERIRWTEEEVVQRAIEVREDDTSARQTRSSSHRQVSSVQPTRFWMASPISASLTALALALFPKCPLCWAAYASLFGIAGLESIPYAPWLKPVLALLLLVSVTSTGLRARTTRRFMPFYFVVAGTLAILSSKLFVGFDAVGLPAVLLILIGSLWSACQHAASARILQNQPTRNY